jgi:hypothetical protein
MADAEGRSVGWHFQTHRWNNLFQAYRRRSSPVAAFMRITAVFSALAGTGIPDAKAEWQQAKSVLNIEHAN